MPIRFENPHVLWTLLLVAAVWALARTSRTRLAPVRAWTSLSLRIASVILLCLALAGPRVQLPSNRVTVLYAVDVSRSMGPGARAEAQRFLREALASAGPKDESGVILFGASALVEEPPRSGVRGEALAGRPDPEATSLAAAVRLAEGIFPGAGVRRLVLLTDGRENRDSLEELLLAGVSPRGESGETGGAPEVFLRKIGGEGPREALVEGVVSPERVLEGQPHEVRVTCATNVSQEGVLRLFRNDVPVGVLRVALSPGEPNVFRFSLRTAESGTFLYRALLEVPNDAFPENNRGASFTRVEGRGRVLLLDRDVQAMLPLRQALEGAGMVIEAGGPDAVPPDLASAARFDAIVIGDMPAEVFSTESMEAIESYVRDLGGGLLMLGGPDSFGPGGWYRTPVERALPVDANLRNRRHLPTQALVLAIDKSGSMTDHPGNPGEAKMELAKEAAANVAEIMGPSDRIGVIAFDDAAKWVAPLDRWENPAALIRKIGTIRGGGGTDPYPALAEAEKALLGVEAMVKHVVLLTDGLVPERDYEGIAKRLLTEQVTVSTVAIGRDADQYNLERIAEWGGGRFFYTDDVRSIPRIFTREAFTVVRAYLVEEPFRPALVGDHPVLGGFDPEKAPPLHGYVASSPKEGAERVLDSPRGDPVLAVWRYGLGRAAAFTSDARGRWGREWVRWEGYSPFWSQCVRWLLRNEGSEELQVSAVIAGDHLQIVADAFEAGGNLRDGADIDALLALPDGGRSSIRLEQFGPGRYEARIPTRGPGIYLGAVVRKERGEAVDGAMAGAIQPYSAEYRTLGGENAGVERLVASGHVRLLADPRLLYSRGRVEGWVEKRIAWWLVLFCAILLPCDVALRRVFLPEGWGPWLRARLGGRREDAPSEERFQVLKTRRERGRSLRPGRSGLLAPPDAPVPLPPPLAGVSDELPGAGRTESAGFPPGPPSLDRLMARKRGRKSAR